MLIISWLIGCNASKKNIDSFNSLDTNQTPAHILYQCRLVWNDEFEGASIDSAKWNYRAEGNFQALDTVSRSTISLDGQGHVIICVIKDADGKYYVGKLGTEDLFETTYGYFKCRAKMNSQLGPMWLSGFSRPI